MIAIDLKKAVNSISRWHFFTKHFHCFGFSESFIIRVKTFYYEICSCVMNNGTQAGILGFNEE